MSSTLSGLFLNRRHPIGRIVVFVAGLATGLPAWADQLATYQSGQDAPIVLMADHCPGDGTGRLKLAYQKKSERDLIAGCWAFDVQKNPVVTWRDGRVQELDAAQVQFEPKYARTMREKRTDAAASQAKAPSQGVVVSRAEVPPQTRAPTVDPASARPAWCKDAKRAHELLICRDPQLSANDLALIPFWRAYRSLMRLDRAEETRVKDDFYLRLKACANAHECIGREQSAQMAFYRKALGYE